MKDVTMLIQRLLDDIEKIVWCKYPHVSMVLPKFYDDGSGCICCIGLEHYLFEWTSLDDFIKKGDIWINDSKK